MPLTEVYNFKFAKASEHVAFLLLYSLSKSEITPRIFLQQNIWLSDADADRLLKILTKQN